MKDRNQIYLDYQATTPLSSRVYDAMKPYYKDKFGNPHSNQHFKGWESNEAVETSREQIASSINADLSEIIFTSGATESNNLAMLGIGLKNEQQRNKVLVSSIEHKCVLSAAQYLSEKGLNVIEVPVNEIGLVDLDFLEQHLDETVLIVSIMDVNNEIGTIQPINQISALCHRVGAIFHSDAAQSMTTKAIDVKRSNVDLLSLSAHKIYGPKGIGALYVEKSIKDRLQPLLLGGGQEQGLRSGTLPTPLCVGFGTAAEIIESERQETILQIAELRNLFYEELKNKRPEIKLIGPNLEDRHVSNLSICFNGYDAEDLISLLQPKLAVSTGSACTTGIPEPSHVLSALGLSSEDAKSIIRFSFGKYTERSDTIKATNILLQSLDKVDIR